MPHTSCIGSACTRGQLAARMRRRTETAAGDCFATAQAKQSPKFSPAACRRLPKRRCGACAISTDNICTGSPVSPPMRRYHAGQGQTSMPRSRAKASGSLARFTRLQRGHSNWMLLISFDPPLDSAMIWSRWNLPGFSLTLHPGPAQRPRWRRYSSSTCWAVNFPPAVFLVLARRMADFAAPSPRTFRTRNATFGPSPRLQPHDIVSWPTRLR